MKIEFTLSFLNIVLLLLFSPRTLRPRTLRFSDSRNTSFCSCHIVDDRLQIVKICKRDLAFRDPLPDVRDKAIPPVDAYSH